MATFSSQNERRALHMKITPSFTTPHCKPNERHFSILPFFTSLCDTTHRYQSREEISLHISISPCLLPSVLWTHAPNSALQVTIFPSQTERRDPQVKITPLGSFQLEEALNTNLQSESFGVAWVVENRRSYVVIGDTANLEVSSLTFLFGRLLFLQLNNATLTPSTTKLPSKSRIMW